jgi:hypothetical protein
MNQVKFDEIMARVHDARMELLERLESISIELLPYIEQATTEQKVKIAVLLCTLLKSYPGLYQQLIGHNPTIQDSFSSIELDKAE